MNPTHSEKDQDPSSLSEQHQVRVEKLQKIIARDKIAYRNGLSPKNLAAKVIQDFGDKTREELESLKSPASLAGRILAIRSFGKAAFIQVQDRSGKIQFYVTQVALGDAKFAEFLEFDLGDIVYSSGYLFKTKTGELSLHTEQIVLLTKALHPMPEKFHGLTDVETRYRQRYLDLISNPESKAIFLKRSKIIDEVRKFFIERDFLEVETPMMHPIAGGATARPFVTHHNTLDMTLYLRIAPELYLKRLLVGGMERVFEINRNFRNEGVSIKHNPEFTMLEFYQAYATFEDLIPLTESLFQKVSLAVNGSTHITYQGTAVELGGSWTRIRVEEAIERYSGFKDSKNIRNPKALLDYCRQKNYSAAEEGMPAGVLQMIIFDEEVEQHLAGPVFVTHYPLDVSPLSRKNEKDPFLVDRFELYIGGREMANAFSELNDPIDQKERFLEQVESKNQGNPEACDMDEDYVTALEYGMPPAAGQGIGIDRMVMLLTDAPSIRDVILFPQLRNSKKE